MGSIKKNKRIAKQLLEKQRGLELEREMVTEQDLEKQRGLELEREMVTDTCGYGSPEHTAHITRKLGETLFLASKNGNFTRVKELLEFGTKNWNVKDFIDVEEPIYYSSSFNVTDQCTDRYSTPLFIAIQNDRPDIVQLLVKSGANITRPLSMALIIAEMDTIETLVILSVVEGSINNKVIMRFEDDDHLSPRFAVTPLTLAIKLACDSKELEEQKVRNKVVQFLISQGCVQYEKLNYEACQTDANSGHLVTALAGDNYEIFANLLQAGSKITHETREYMAKYVAKTRARNLNCVRNVNAEGCKFGFARFRDDPDDNRNSIVQVMGFSVSQTDFTRNYQKQIDTETFYRQKQIDCQKKLCQQIDCQKKWCHGGGCDNIDTGDNLYICSWDEFRGFLEVEAARLLFVAAKLGYADAQWQLSQLIFKGNTEWLTISKRVLNQGSIYLKLAARQNHIEAKEQISAKCFYCQTPAKKKCSRCLAVRYCSNTCQKSHYKEHKAHCKLTIEYEP
jgi:ankyrin repeat protein